MLRFYDNKKDGLAKQIVFYANLVVFVVSAFYLGTYCYNNADNKHKADMVNDQIGEIDHSTLEKDEEGKYIDRYVSLRKDYPDLVGRVTYDYYNAKRVLPVMQTDNNTDYIYSDVLKKHSDAGTPFVDYRCDVKDSLITVIYAHNMSDLSQFGALKLYKDESYWKEHKIVIYETQYEEPVQYEIVAAFYSQIYVNGEDKFKYYAYFSLNDKETYDYYVSNCKELAQYDTGITPQFGEKLLLLSTCDKTQHIPDGNGRFAVLCRRTDNRDDSNGDINVATPKPDESEDEENNEDDNDEQNTDDEQNSNDNNNNEDTPSNDSEQTQATKKPVVTKKPEATPAPVVTKEPTPEPEPTEEPTEEPVVTEEPTQEPEVTDPPVVEETEAPSEEGGFDGVGDLFQ